ncbi:hypothetical protein [Nocardioides insulae]|uniref:hypothetical protein n=1 Tax=Nocardioides insulae TaxID=394734 RepID=UPI000422D109|nr:hypothetical protein [Nocardioides insulae]
MTELISASENSTTTSSGPGSWERFERTTTGWGRATMLATLLVTLAGPYILVQLTGARLSDVFTVFWAIALAFGVVWFVEPITYYPMLGSASMYQAFMIGNISSKLLPAALVAQEAVGAKPGTRKAQLASVLAICGAVVVHLIALTTVVGVLGSWLLSVMPAFLLQVVQTNVLAAIIGAVLVQMVLSNPKPIIVAIAAVVGTFVIFFLVPNAPALFGETVGSKVAMFGTLIAVLLTIGISILVAKVAPQLLGLSAGADAADEASTTTPATTSRDQH